MAEAIARYDAADVMDPSSAGLVPLGYIADLTKQTLARNGYSADELTSKGLARDAAERADLIINMTGERREGNYGDVDKVEDWIVEDPYGADPETYQRVFESLRRQVSQLALSLREKRQSKKAAG